MSTPISHGTSVLNIRTEPNLQPYDEDARLSSALDLAITYHRKSIPLKLPKHLLASCRVYPRYTDSWSGISMSDIDRLATKRAYDKRNFILVPFIKHSPTYAWKCIAKGLTRYILEEEQLRIAISNFCLVNSESQRRGRQWEYFEDRISKLYTSYLLDLYEEACIILSDLGDYVTEKLRAGLRGRLKQLIGIGKEQRLPRRGSWVSAIKPWQKIDPYEFINQISRAESGLRFGLLEMNVQKREAWAELKGKDFILSSNALKVFKDRLRALRKPIISVEAI
ncbi:hypothetical protein BDZ45DRAFT_390663 [Acephala macrosclerotiorum]|nr:hypothetical protein BDZ45DRAFT_390663 [Acephala macrosclerotiorum]